MPIFIVSCSNEEKDLFEDSAANRISAALEKYRNILVDAPNGWLMEYYAGEKDDKKGGYNILCSFNANGEVTLTGDIMTLKEIYPDHTDKDIKVKSLYSLISDHSPVLTFDTYNPIIHYFGYPMNGPNNFKGDYEFIFMGGDENRIELRGKKYKNRIILTRFSKDNTWDGFLDKVDEIIDKTFVFGLFDLVVNGSEPISVSLDYNRTFTFKVGSELIKKNAIYTENGIKFYDPVTFNGREFQSLVWDQASKGYTNEDKSVILKVHFAADHKAYEDFLGTYTFSYDQGAPKTVTIEQKTKEKSYTVKSMFPFDAVAEYSTITGRISIVYQTIGTYQGLNVGLCPWDTSAARLTSKSGAGLESVLNMGSLPGIDFTFKDNGVWRSYVANALIVWTFNGSDFALEYPTNSQYSNMRFVKK